MANNQIALLAQAPAIDPLERAQRQATLRQLAEQQRAQEQSIKDEQVRRTALQADPTGGEGYIRALAQGGDVKGYYAAREADLKARETSADILQKKATAGKTGVEAINLRTQRYRDALNTVGDLPSAQAWVQGMYRDPEVGPWLANELGPMEGALQRIPDPAVDPEGFAKWKLSSQLGADKLAEAAKRVIGSRKLGDREESTITDPLTGKVTVTGTAKIGQSPDSVATNETSRANARLQADTSVRNNNATNETSRANARLQAGAAQYDADRGVLIDRATGQARPVVGADGQPLGAKQKPIPESARKAMLENEASLRKVDAALEAASAYPEAFGVRNYLGDTVRQRTDPEGVKARALTADIGSLKIHDRSGAAVTAAETPRLKPFIPAATDHPDVVKQKLELFREEYQAIQRDMQEAYSADAGFRQPGGRAPNAAPPPPKAGAVETGSDGKKYRFKGGNAADPNAWEPM